MSSPASPAPLDPISKNSRWSIELGVLLGLLTVIGGTWFFIEIAEGVSAGTTQSFDDWLRALPRNPADRSKLRGPEWVTEGVRDITALGGYVFLTLLTAGVVGFLAIVGKHTAARFITVAVVGGFLLNMGLKAFFSRERPPDDDIAYHSYVATSSFPSGHSMMSAIVYLTMGALLSRFADGRGARLYLLGVAILLTFLVGTSRVMMGVHYPTDVLGGWTAGLVWATASWLVARRWQLTHPASLPNGKE